MLFNVNYELHSEDAPPLNNQKKDNGVLGSFDGMGGAGGMQYTMPDGTKRSGAYLASRQVREIVSSFVSENYKQILLNPETAAEKLTEDIFRQLTRYADENNLRPNIKIRGTMIKLLPTTMAVIVYREEKETVTAVCLWCGDSRCYVLSPETGLSQLTTDDLTMQNDAMENLLSDSPMSNNIYLPLTASAEPPFKIHVRSCSFQKPCLLFTATDGCFGYLQSPMHFEKIILDAVKDSAHQNVEELGFILQEAIQKITSDDCTLSARVFMDTDSTEALNELFEARNTSLTHLLADFTYEKFGAAELIGQISALEARQENVTAFLEAELKNHFIASVEKSLETAVPLGEIDTSLSSCSCISKFTDGYNFNGAVPASDGKKAAEAFYEKNARMLFSYLLKNYQTETDSQLAVMLSAYRQNQEQAAELMRAKKEVDETMQTALIQLWSSAYKKDYEQYLTGGQ